MQNCTILTFVSSVSGYFWKYHRFSLALRWGEVSKGVTSLRALKSLTSMNSVSAGTSIHPPSLLLSGPGALFQVMTSLPWVVLWSCLFPVLPVSLSLTAQLSPADLPALPRGSKVLPCLGLLWGLSVPGSAPQDSTSWWAHQGSPCLLPWPLNHRQLSSCCPLASTRLEEPWPSYCPFGTRTGHTLLWCQAQLCCIVLNWLLLPTFDQQPCATTLEPWMAEKRVNMNDNRGLELSYSYSQTLMSPI